MSKEKHLFFILSDFHYLICKSIIQYNQLDLNDCFFVCWRGTNIEKGMQSFPLPMGMRSDFLNRFKFYLRKPYSVHSFFGGNNVIAYLPYSYLLPKKSYVKSIVFYEEGFSAYSYHQSVKQKKMTRRCFGERLLNFMMHFVKKDARGYLLLYDTMTVNSKLKTQLYVCSPNSYSHHDTSSFEIKVIDIAKVSYGDFFSTIPSGSYFVVLDRIIPRGRPFELDNYKKCLHKIVLFCLSHHVHEIWTRLHPADWNYDNARSFVEKFFDEEGVRINWYMGNVEILAKQNQAITFLGTNSTCLYYAPKLGTSNICYSFSKYLAAIDKEYEQFLNVFGGLDEFVEVFSKNVICLGVEDLHLSNGQ